MFSGNDMDERENILYYIIIENSVKDVQCTECQNVICKSDKVARKL